MARKALVSHVIGWVFVAVASWLTLLATWAVHDLNHIAQIARVMAQRYTEEVGAWRNYLSILNG